MEERRWILFGNPGNLHIERAWKTYWVDKIKNQQINES